jgi:VWFA-related protein
VNRTFGRVLLVLIFVSSSYAADPDFVFHKQVNEVRLTVVATDAQGRPWPGLAASSLAVADEGLAISDFHLQSANDLPLQVGVLLDLSDSTHGSWPAVRAALTQSMEGLLRPSDQILMITFNSRIQTERVLAEANELDESLPTPAGGLTALYDTLYGACAHPLFSGDSEPHRAALILFSDGEDNMSYRGLGDAIASAQKSGIAIYTIAMHKPHQWHRGDGVLRAMASATGGNDFVVSDVKGMQAALQTIHEELRNSYLLYYRPSSGEMRGDFRRVDVLPARDARLHLRTRSGYYAKP